MPDGICPFADWRPPFTKVYSTGSINRVGFCDHTAGGFYTTLASRTFWDNQGYSVHFGIGRKGEICQIVNIFDRAWGQGRLGSPVSWPPYSMMNFVNPNEYLISIEHEDAITVNSQTVFIPNSEWTEEQYLADLAVKRWCMEEILRVTGEDILTFGIDSLAGHHMFDPQGRYFCPGKFWREQYRERLYSDLNSPPEEEFIMAQPVWAAWKDMPSNKIRTYLLFSTPTGPKKRWLNSSTEESALREAGIIGEWPPLFMSLSALKEYAGRPEPDE